jgi:hypothetical protein
MGRSWSLAALILALAAPGGPDAAAQTLDLDAAGEPPALGLDTFAAHCVRQLEEEMAVLARQPADTAGPAGDVLRAALGVRWLAAALLERADRGTDGGSLDFIAGLRLYRGCADLDETLKGVLEPDSDPGAASALRRFNDRLEALPRELPAEEGADPDEQLGALLRPLADAVAALAPGPVANHYVVAGDISHGAGIGEPAGTRIDELLRQLEARIDTARLAEQTAGQLRRINEYLRRGSAFDEYQPFIERYCRLLAEVLDLADAAHGAEWLDEDRREHYRLETHEAVALFGDPYTRREAVQRLRRLAAARHAIDRISTLAQGPEVDLEALQMAFLVDPGDQDPDMETLVRVLDAMIAYRDLAEPQLPHELRRAWRKLDASYRAAERALMEELAVLVGRPDALSNPALAGLLLEHEQHLGDLERLAKVPAWVETVRFISARGAGPFSGHVRRLAGWLTDPVRRPDAVRALGAIEQQLDDYYPMPFEQALRQGGRPAIMATGGLHEQLVARIDDERRAWAEAWDEGALSPTARRMRLLYRLTRTMADTETLLELGDDALILNRWAAWELEPEAFRRLVADLGNRLKLATTAALEADDAGLRDQLDRIQAPTAALVNRLAEALREPLGRLPPGALSIVGQCVRRPGPDAWMLARRGEIADICRFEMELQHARATGREEQAARLTAYVDMLAGDLLEEISP